MIAEGTCVYLRYDNWSWSAATSEERLESPLADETILQQGIEVSLTLCTSP